MTEIGEVPNGSREGVEGVRAGVEEPEGELDSDVEVLPRFSSFVIFVQVDGANVLEEPAHEFYGYYHADGH